MQRKVFRGVGAMIVNPSTHRKFHIVTKITDTQKFEFDPGRTIVVDLGLTPSRTTWGDIRVDDRGISADRIPLASGPCVQLLEGFHVTSIGGSLGPDTDDLGRGCLIGAVYLENGYFQEVRDRIDVAGNPWPSDDRKSYQLTSISYSNAPENGARKNLRYHGFEGRIAALGTDSKRRVELFDIYDRSLGEFDLDFENPYHVDDPAELAGNEQALTTTSRVGDHGAVYVELAKLAAEEVNNPKLPIAAGD